MSVIHRKQQQRLGRELKSYAFDESPQFADPESAVQAMEIIRTFEVEADHSEVVIEMGMRAVRMTLDDGDEAYSFHVHCHADRQIEPVDLRLPPEDWYQIASLYDWDEYDEDEDEDDDVSPGDVKTALEQEGALCLQYERVDYRFDTADGALRFSNERGYKVAGEHYGVSETHPVDVSYRSLPDVADLTEESDGDSIVTQILFEEATAGLRDEFAETGDIMPGSEKLKELRFLVGCLRERRINL